MTFSQFIKRFYFIPIFLTAFLFVACQNNEKQKTDAEANDAVPEMTLEQKKQQLNSVTPSSSSNNRAASGSNINPPHGQPGHRCDVPVGASLDGSGSSNEKTIKVGPSSTTPAATSKTSPVASPTINPPHGQPGHRCDVKVGDRLPTS